MSRTFDHGGTLVSKSHPVKSLKTSKKILLIDSADRDTTKYYTNGDFVVYLPRVYENVVSIRLMGAEFPPVVSASSAPGVFTHSYVYGPNLLSGVWNPSNQATPPTGSAKDAAVAASSNIYYFIVDIEGLNKVDETTVASQKSTFADSFYAKIPVLTTAYGSQSFIEYNDHSLQENIAKYSPALNKLDRLHIRTRLHSQQDRSGFIYWTSDGGYAGSSTNNTQKAEFNLTLEIEYLDNVFDDFSSLETHLTNRY